MNNFIDLDHIDTSILRHILMLGKSFKNGISRYCKQPLKDRILAMIFEKPSTRTRVSFEVGMYQLGGSTIVLNHNDMQLVRGETIADTARVLSRYVDVIMIRTDDRNKLAELAKYSTVPIINGLTNYTHPCQVMADVMTYEEHRGSLEGKIVSWSGDGNNMANTWIQATVHFGFEIRLACPIDLMPDAKIINWARNKGANVLLTNDPVEAVQDADCVLTDTWVSMGCLKNNHHDLLPSFQINEKLMTHAKPNAVFMHCLPAHRGKEVTDSVIDGPQSLVWDEAENRMHIQKGILTWCLS
ncbi:MAG: ornithine carbamoyltransferase [Rhodospirillaceae bacterium]|jgi:ornithine carbamoyltransferase|nr:ornithine carbamoyltransferase [Rhodospirillaceae bacterium]